MIVSANGATKEKERIVQRIEEFLDMIEESDELIRFSVSFGQAEEDKFRVSNAINGIGELTDNEDELLEEHGMSRETWETKENLEMLSFSLDEREDDE